MLRKFEKFIAKNNLKLILFIIDLCIYLNYSYFFANVYLNRKLKCEIAMFSGNLKSVYKVDYLIGFLEEIKLSECTVFFL